MEEYVNKKIANLLKEKGFDWQCRAYYNDDGALREDVTVPNDWNNSGCFNHMSAPTLQMACEWVRLKHNIFIGVSPRLSFTDYYYITANIYRVEKKGSLYHEDDVDGYRCVAACDETSPLGAITSALEYTLENLI